LAVEENTADINDLKEYKKILKWIVKQSLTLIAIEIKGVNK
jgi:hypothetical protein